MKFSELSVANGALDYAVLASPLAAAAGVTNNFTPGDRNPASAGMRGDGNTVIYSSAVHSSQSGLEASAKHYRLPGILSCREDVALSRCRPGSGARLQPRAGNPIRVQVDVTTIEGHLLLSLAAQDCPARRRNSSIKIKTLDNKYKGVLNVS